MPSIVASVVTKAFSLPGASVARDARRVLQSHTALVTTVSTDSYLESPFIHLVEGDQTAAAARYNNIQQLFLG